MQPKCEKKYGIMDIKCLALSGETCWSAGTCKFQSCLPPHIEKDCMNCKKYKVSASPVKGADNVRWNSKSIF